MAALDYVKGMFAETLASKQAKKIQEEEARKTPAMRQHEYAVARQSILGEFWSLPITGRQRCITDAKAARRQERLDLVNRAIAACPKHAAEAARLRADMDEVENMRCAKHVYLANDPNAPADLRENPPPGFKKATPEQLAAMGLDENMLRPDHSSFRAEVYVKDPAVWGPNPTPEAILSFRGSTADDKNWKNNFAQDCNKQADHYQKAVEIGNRLAARHAPVHLVGHSLGGGLASAAQGGSGLTASTYNAAGLHPETVPRYSHDGVHRAAEPKKITAIRTEGEILTTTQENLVGSRGISLLANNAVGIKRDLPPSHNREHFNKLKEDKKVDGDSDYPTYLHGMDEVIDSTEQQKKMDEALLKTCLSGGRH
jgi:hypothetical protein